jgi:hypothetical protein
MKGITIQTYNMEEKHVHIISHEKKESLSPPSSRKSAGQKKASAKKSYNTGP